MASSTRSRRALGNGLGTSSVIGLTLGEDSPAGVATVINSVQEWVLDNTRLGIPVLFHGEAFHGAMITGGTMFPQAIALGSTWDPDLLKQMFAVVGKESRAVGNALVLAPVLDLGRDPRYGRIEEMYSEDPFLTGTLGVAAIKGLQGESERFDQDHVIATAKHFIHGQPENGTNVGPSDFSERTMRQFFLRPFEMAIKQARLGAVMPSYNENNGGIPSHADSWLLNDVLRREWGFTGLTTADYWGVARLHKEHHVAKDFDDAGVLAFNSGVDMDLPNPAGFGKLADAVRAGKVRMADIDAAVARVLAAKFRAGLFENPFADPARAVEVVNAAKNAPLARKVADEAIILLKNDGGILPLDPSKVGTVAVIGPNADK